MKLPALSIRQPWSWSILFGGKSVENRSRPSKLRGPLLLHVSKYMPCEQELCEAEVELNRLVPECVEFPAVDDLPFGGIAGAIWIDGMLEPTRRPYEPWHQKGCYGWHIGKVLTLPFRAFKGKVGIFYVDLTKVEVAILQEAKWIP